MLDDRAADEQSWIASGKFSDAQEARSLLDILLVTRQEVRMECFG